MTLALVTDTRRISPTALAQRCDTGRGGQIVRALCAYHPNSLSRDELMRIAGISVWQMGAVSAYASFAFWVDRANDVLPAWGWRINGGLSTGNLYSLVPA